MQFVVFAKHRIALVCTMPTRAVVSGGAGPVLVIAASHIGRDGNGRYLSSVLSVSGVQPISNSGLRFPGLLVTAHGQHVLDIRRKCGSL